MIGKLGKNPDLKEDAYLAKSPSTSKGRGRALNKRAKGKGWILLPLLGKEQIYPQSKIHTITIQWSENG